MQLDYAITAVPTPEAAACLGIGATTLKRWAGADAIFLEGEHWKRRRPYQNSVKLFNLPECVCRMQGLGYAIPQTTLELIADAGTSLNVHQPA